MNGHSEPDICHFFYGSDGITQEAALDYKQYGFHPILLGDILPTTSTCATEPGRDPRYRIVTKLGYGGFATVWLARDLVKERFVALKVAKGSDSKQPTSEVLMLREVRQLQKKKAPGSNIIIKLFDDFVIKGPNGYHQCLVTEVVIPFHDRNPFWKRPSTKEFCRQLTEGFAFLHRQGIVHADPHPGNLGVAFPEMNNIKEEDIVDNAELLITPVVPRIPQPLEEMRRLPAYCVGVSPFSELLGHLSHIPKGSSLEARIMDFGRAYKVTADISSLPALSGGVPLAYRSPEAIIYNLSKGKHGVEWSKSSDVWALGCLLFNTRFHSLLFTEMGNLSDALYWACRYGGGPVESWLAFWDPKAYCRERAAIVKSTFRPNLPEDPLCFDRDTAWENVRQRVAAINLADEQLEVDGADFLDLLMRMIVIDTDKRISMEGVLGHSFWRPRGVATRT